MKLTKIIENHPNAEVTISLKELLEFAEEVALNMYDIAISTQRSENTIRSEYVTRSEYMKRMDICAATFWRWNKNGDIKTKTVGRRVYVHESEIKEWK